MKRKVNRGLALILAVIFCLTVSAGAVNVLAEGVTEGVKTVISGITAIRAKKAHRAVTKINADIPEPEPIREPEPVTEPEPVREPEPAEESNPDIPVVIPEDTENPTEQQNEEPKTNTEPEAGNMPPAENPTGSDMPVQAAAESGSVTFHNELKKGSLKITKTSENGLVEGLTFRLHGTSLTGETVDLTATTNAQGVALFENVPISGDTPYIVEEVGTPNYFIVPATQNVSIEWNTVTDAAFYNALKKGSAKVIKTTEFGSVEGLKFRLYGTSDAGTTVDEHGITDANGEILWTDIPVGTYTVEEEETPDCYIVPASRQVTVTENGTAEVHFENLLKKGAAKVIKTAEYGSVEGLTFRLFGTSDAGEAIDMTAATDAQGIALFANVPIGTYTVEEVNTPDYYIAPAPQQVTITENGTAEVHFENLLKKGAAKVIKTAEYGSVEGLTFRLFGTSDAGQAIDMTAITDAQGIALFANVPIGTYTVEEVNTPAYYIAPASQQVTVTENGTAEVHFENLLKKGAAKVIKTAEYGSVEGLTFRLFGTSDAGEAIDMTAATDAQGIALFANVPIGTYTVEEVNTPDYYIAPASQQVTITENGTAEVVFNNALKKGAAKVIKTAEYGSVEGLTFRLFGTSDAGEAIDMTAITDAQGIALFANVPIGTYTVEEVNTPDYYIAPASQQVTVTENGTAEVHFENLLKKGAAKVIKTAEYGSVEGLTFRLFGTSDAGEAIDMTAITDAQGIALFANVPIGTYTVEEVNTPDYYITPASQQVTITENGTAEVSFNNALEKGNIKVIKTADDDLIEGLSFRLFGTSDAGEAIDMTAITDAQGIALFADVPYGTYTVEEVNTPDRYLPVDPVTVTVNADTAAEIIEIRIHNVLRLGSLKIHKTSEDGKVEGIGFTVKDPNGTLLTDPSDGDTIFTTNANGDIVITNLRPGEYVVHEIVPDGYIPQPDQTVTVIADETVPANNAAALSQYNAKLNANAAETENNIVYAACAFLRNSLSATEDNIVHAIGAVNLSVSSANAVRQPEPTDVPEVVFKNELIRGNIALIKLDALDTNMKLSGAVFDVYADTNGNNEYDADDALVGRLEETTEAGIYMLSNLPYGKYFVKETTAPEGYILDVGVYEVFISENGKTYWIENAEGIGFVNEPEKPEEKGSLKIIKTSEDGNVAGIEFVITQDGAKTIIAATNADGIIEIPDLLPGVYTVTETVSAGYEPQPPQTVTVAAGETATVTFHNVLKRGSLKIVKTSEDGNVAGITFIVTGENVNETVTTDGNGEILIPNLLPGVYTVTEQTPDEYEPQPPQTITVAAGETATVTFHNMLKRGSLKIVKTSDDGIIAGFSFRVTSENGYDETFITDENGEIVIENLPVGKYTVSEVENEASSRYFIPEAVTVEVGSDSAVTVEVKMHNSLIPVPPKTGDKNRLGIGLLLIGTAVATVGLVLVHKSKNKKGRASVND